MLEVTLSPVSLTLVGFICVVLGLAVSYAGFGLKRVRARNS
jgi:hypothetical protein